MSKANHPKKHPDLGLVSDEEGYFSWCLEKAKKGDHSCAEAILHAFCECVQQRRPIPKPILDYLYMGFHKHLSEGQELSKALYLNRPKARPEGTVTVDPVKAVALIYLYMKRDGLRKGAAIDAVCNALPISKRHLERHDKELSAIRDMDLDNLNLFALEMPPAKK